MSTPLLDSLDAQAIARLCLSTGAAGEAEQVRQTQERIDILRSWFTPAPGQVGCFSEADFVGTVVELGCGQGDATAVIAALLRKAGRGKVYGVDPGALDYGSPFTLAQAQGHLANGPLKSTIEFRQGDASLLADLPAVDTLALLHSLWYFPHTEEVRAMAAAARSKAISRVCLAEWDVRSPAMAHRKAVEIQRDHPVSGGNIRTVLSPPQTVALMQQEGYQLLRQHTLPSPAVDDGLWEVGTSKRQLQALRARALEADPHSSQALVLGQELEALHALVPPKGEPVPTLNVWTGVFTLQK